MEGSGEWGAVTGEEEDGWEEEGTPLSTIKPLQPLKGSPPAW